MTLQQSGLGKTCILGGTGFVGSHLASRLVRDGHRVRIPTRSRQRARDLLVLPGVELVQADIHDDETLAAVLAGCDNVVNLIGILNEKGHDGSGFRAAHVEMAERLVRACRQAGVRRLVQMSALKANAERGPSHYLQTKGEAEQIIKRGCAGQIRYAILRPSVIFGPGDSFLNRFAGLLRWFPALPLARADARFSPVHVDDVVTAMLRCLREESTDGKTFELCGPETFTLLELVQFVRRRMGIRRAVFAIPDPLARLQAFVCEYFIPGKPLSLDNLRSLSVASVCSSNGFSKLAIKPRKLTTSVPAYMGVDSNPSRIARLRNSSSG